MCATRSKASRPQNQNGHLGLIGLGLMGSALAERLLAAGWDILGWDMNTARIDQFTGGGGVAAKDTAEVFACCEQILLSLPNDEIVATVLDKVRSELRPNQVIIDTSTGAPDASVRFGMELGSLGVSYLDATVSGSSTQIRAGTSVWLVGGKEEAFARCRRIFAAVSPKAFHLGPWGSGSKLKLVSNLILGLNRAALAEGLVFAQALGLDLTRSLDILRETVAYSRVMDTKGSKMILGQFEPEARLSQHLKDVRLMLAAAARAGKRLPLSEAHQELLERAELLGLGALDNSAIIRVLDPLSGAHAFSPGEPGSPPA